MTSPSGDKWMTGAAYEAYMGRWSRVNQSDEDEIIDQSLSLAVRLAQKADKSIESDDENGKA